MIIITTFNKFFNLVMKKEDLLFAVIICAIFSPFFISPLARDWYFSFNANHGMLMAFIKFAILSTIGELIGLRISTGSYISPTFGPIPRMVIWGMFGLAINMAMIIFSKGVPIFLEYTGVEGAVASMGAAFTAKKFFVALAISVAMNSIFAPVFMSFHKITDMHIANNNGSIRTLITPIPMSDLITKINWKVHWSFVFKCTIPLFWYPAHTITFLLPENYRVLFAALLGVALGILLAIAAKKK